MGGERDGGTGGGGEEKGKGLAGIGWEEGGVILECLLDRSEWTDR